MRCLAALFLVLTLSGCAHLKPVPIAKEIHPPEILMKRPQPLSPINPLNVIQSSQNLEPNK